MQSTKPWWQSISVWVSMFQAVFGIIVGAGGFPGLPDIFSGGSLATGGTIAGLAALNLFGRVRANTVITATDKTPAVKRPSDGNF